MQVERDVWKMLMAITAAAMVAGCAHREEVRYGSIKDDAVATTRSARGPAVAGDVRRGPAVVKAAGSKVAVAPAARGGTTAEGAAATAPGAASAAPAATPAAAGTAAAAAAGTGAAGAGATPPAAKGPATSASAAAPAAPDRAPRLRNDQDTRAVSLQLLAEGQRLFSLGKVVEARKRYFAAMDGPVPDVLLALARSFDTYYLSRLRQPDAAPDMARALALYERAAERGSAEARAELERIRGGARQPAAPAVPGAPAPDSAVPVTPPAPPQPR